MAGDGETATHVPGADGPVLAVSGHVIVCGLAGVGMRVIEQLHLAGVDVVLVDPEPDERLLGLVRAWGVPHLRGGARLHDTLVAAGLAKARAVVCVERTELATLETALVARELNADVRIVVQLANEGVGDALGAALGNGVVLDVASLTAPAFVEACRDRPIHEMRLAGEPFAAAETAVVAAGTFRSLFGDLAPIAVLRRGIHGGEVVVCPGRDERLAPGDVVTLVGPPGELAARGIPEAAGGAAGAPAGAAASAGVVRPRWPFGRPGRIRRSLRLSRALALARTLPGEIDRPIYVVAGLLVGLVAISSVLLAVFYHRPGGRHLGVVNSIYFTVEVLSTVGFGDFSFSSQPLALEVYGIALIVLGVALVTTMFALLTNLLVSRRIAESLGRSRVPRMRRHVVVGLGSVGVRVVEELVAAGEPVVVVDADGANRYLERIRALDVPVIVGDATLRETLASVNLAGARSLAALTSDDLTNIEVGLAARNALAEAGHRVPVVLRVFDRRLARTVETGFGLRFVRSTAALAAPFFVGAALGLSVQSTFYVDDQPLLVGRLEVAHGGGLEGLAMGDLSSRIRVLALRRAAGGRLEHPPRRGTRFAAGDEAYLVGPYEELIAVLRRDERLVR